MLFKVIQSCQQLSMRLCSPVLHSFRELADYWYNFRWLLCNVLKSALSEPPEFKFARFIFKKPETSLCEVYFDIMNCSCMTHECDGQTDRHFDSKYRASLRCVARQKRTQKQH